MHFSLQFLSFKFLLSGNRDNFHKIMRAAYFSPLGRKPVKSSANNTNVTSSLTENDESCDYRASMDAMSVGDQETAIHSFSVGLDNGKYDY